MCAILRDNRAPIIGASFAKGISIEGTGWRRITGPNTIGVIKAIWVDTNPKRAVLRLIDMARKMAGTEADPLY